MELVKSCLNYTGNKYDLLEQIIPLFPDNIDTFYDLFGGGCNVGINVECNRVIYNDTLLPLVDLFSNLKTNDLNYTMERYLKTLNKLKLHDKENYYKFREEYNRNPIYYKLIILSMCSFCNMIRFNKKNGFNATYGRRNTGKDNTYFLRLEKFIKRLQETNINFYNESYKFFDYFNENDFVYIDPPYLLTGADYNNGWNEESEKELLEYLDNLNKKGIKFALSNVLENKGKENTILKEWSKNYNIHYIDKKSYKLQQHNKSKVVEVLITNY